MSDAPNPQIDELIAVLHRLRAPGGCAWDRDQTHASLVQYLVEETYELVDAIESGDAETARSCTFQHMASVVRDLAGSSTPSPADGTHARSS